jgi:hypothetical protein
MTSADRTPYFEQFRKAGIVSSLEELISMPHREFEGILTALHPSGQIPEIAVEQNSLPAPSIEERIRALPIPAKPINLNDRLECGRALARELILARSERNLARKSVQTDQ